MAKDDYFVLAYRILSYLYECLKSEARPDLDYLSYETKEFPIGRTYWSYIMKHLSEDGYIEGVLVSGGLGDKAENVRLLKSVCITPKGIEYLMDNSTLQKAKQFLKDLKDVLPI